MAAIAVLLLPYLFSRLASSSRCVTIYSIADGEQPVALPKRLRIVSYNIAHGRGLASSNWNGGDRTARRGRLSDIADLLVELDADIVVLNEVDFDSSWSGHVNQADLLAMLAEYPYRVEQRNLDVRVLGWTWRFGNAVLSRYPIVRAEVVDLPGYSVVETALVGKKRAVDCDVQVGEQQVRIVGAHLSHRSETVRVHSARTICNLVRYDPRALIVAGDLNSTPTGLPYSTVSPDRRNAIEEFDASDFFHRTMPANPLADALTFPADKPDRAIDWVLIPRDWRFEKYQVVPTTLSDHRPVVSVATWLESPSGEP